MAEPLPLPKGYQRLGSFPIDKDSVFTDLATMEAYISGGSSYPGHQVFLVDVDANTVTAYNILPDKSYVPAGNDNRLLYEIYFPSAQSITILLESNSTITSVTLSAGITLLQYSSNNVDYITVTTPLEVTAGLWYFKPNAGGNVILKGTK